MDNQPAIYNSRITKIYVEYLKVHYPEIDVDLLLRYAGMTRDEVEDPAHWFRQEQVDRFHRIVARKTGRPEISREAGRYAASTGGLGPIKQYALSLLGPESFYLLVNKIAGRMTRASCITAKKLGSNRIEIVFTPKPGVHEKPYQCENRLGTLESAAKLFTKKGAAIEHSSCLHRGDKSCRYVISWKNTVSFNLRRIRDVFLFLGTVVCLAAFPALSTVHWAALVGVFVLSALGMSFLSEHLQNKELTKALEDQGQSARAHLDELNVRYNNALLIQEIGKAVSAILDIDELVTAVMPVMKQRLDFDRGMILFTQNEGTALRYQAGFGYSENELRLVKRIIEMGPDRMGSDRVLGPAFRGRKEFLCNDLSELKGRVAPEVLETLHELEVRSFLGVPVALEKQTFGLLIMDNPGRDRALTKSDLNLVSGIASEIAVGIANALSVRRLQQEEKKYRDLVQGANSIILRSDINGNILFFNDYAQEFFGYREHEIIGKNIQGTILPASESTSRRLQKLAKLLKSKPDHQIVEESKNLLRNGDRVWIAWAYRPTFDSDGQITEILCIGTDLTEQKRAREEKSLLEARLSRARKMEAIGTLAGGVAHDLNNILSGLVSYPELLVLDLPEDSPLRKPLLTIKKSGEKAAQIVQDLLTLARRGVDNVDVEIVDLNQVVLDYQESPEYRQLISDHPLVRVRVRLQSQLHSIAGSSLHLWKIVMNLISNAAESMPEGGRVTITTENLQVDRPIYGFEEIPNGQYVTLSISDTGIGIPRQDTEKIFEPFFTTKTMGRSGTGLGMAVIWGALKDHHGYIDVQSRENAGTTFTLYFPSSRNQSTPREPAPTIENIMGEGESVLVVDDNDEQRNISGSMLKTLGYSVRTFPSGEALISYLEGGSADLVILDMIMEPGLNGLETYRRILECHPAQKVMITSGYAETSAVREAQRLGAGSLLRKPYSLDKLGKAVRTRLAAG